jgi:hypothetical protein
MQFIQDYSILSIHSDYTKNIADHYVTLSDLTNIIRNLLNLVILIIIK